MNGESECVATKIDRWGHPVWNRGNTKTGSLTHFHKRSAGNLSGNYRTASLEFTFAKLMYLTVFQTGVPFRDVRSGESEFRACSIWTL